MRTFDEVFGDLCERWAAIVSRRPARAIVLGVTLSLALFAAGLPHFGLDSNEDILFSEDLEFVPRRVAWRELFPDFRDPILVQVEAPTGDLADAAARALEKRLQREPELFQRVDRPGAGDFFERNGLLYLETEDLEELADRLVAAQPMLASLNRDPTLRGLSDLLGDAIERSGAAGEGGTDPDLAGEAAFSEALDAMASVFESHVRGSPESLAWSDWIRGESESTPRRLLRVQPAYAFDRVNPAGASIDRLREVFSELGLANGSGEGRARARMTGVYVLAEEESSHVSQQSTIAGLLSFVLVAIVLGTGLRSWRLVLAALATLLTGLAATAGLASLAFGRLNLISVAFAVLFIGLSVDFAIHLGLAALERIRSGVPRALAIRAAAGEVGSSLVLCATTTAIGFYAFGPTPYRGVAELGLIAGTGMFISLAANLTLLPAFLALGGRDAAASPGAPEARPPALSIALARLVSRGRVAILGVAACLAIAGGYALSNLRFDVNPISLREPSAPSVMLFDELLEDGDAVIWNVSALAPDLEGAAALAQQLAALPTVDRTLSLHDYVPLDQETHLEILDDLAYVLVPALSLDRIAAPTATEQRAALERLHARIQQADLERGPPLTEPLRRFTAALGAFLEDPNAPLRSLEKTLLGSLPDQLVRLRTALGPEPITLSSLPENIRSEWIATDGRVRVETYPAEDLDEDGALERYVEEILAAAPGAYGEAYTIQRSGEAVATSLRSALGIAAVGIALLLLLLWRRVADTLLVLIPLGLAALLTAGSSVWLGLPLNFANVLVIPLLLGMGVDSSIHLVHRLRSSTLPGDGLLATTTARAVWLSALTTGASFGTLGLSSHPALSSLGRLLAVGLGWILVCNLLVLPALLARRAPRTGRGSPS